MVPNDPSTPTTWVGVSSRGRAYEIVTCVFVSLSCLAVILRLVARLTGIRKLLLDDYFSIISQVFAFGLIPLAVVFTESGGMGWHVTALPPSQVEKFFQLFFAAELLYGLTSLFYKLAVLFLYRNIFGHVKKFNIASWITTGVTIAWYIGGMFSTIFQCTPIEKVWLPATPGHCINTEAYILGNGVVNLALDVLILFLPFPMIWGLNLTMKRKLALSGMFLIGSVVCIASIFRITTLISIDLLDPTYGLFNVSVWSVIELCVGIIAACLPTLRQLFFRRKTGYSGYEQHYGSRTKTPLDSVDRSQTAVALTGWTSKEAYTEAKSAMSTPHIAEIVESGMGNFASSFLDTDPNIGGVSDEDIADSRSIKVKTEVSVVYQH